MITGGSLGSVHESKSKAVAGNPSTASNAPGPDAAMSAFDSWLALLMSVQPGVPAQPSFVESKMNPKAVTDHVSGPSRGVHAHAVNSTLNKKPAAPIAPRPARTTADAMDANLDHPGGASRGKHPQPNQPIEIPSTMGRVGLFFGARHPAETHDVKLAPSVSPVPSNQTVGASIRDRVGQRTDLPAELSAFDVSSVRYLPKSQPVNPPLDAQAVALLSRIGTNPIPPPAHLPRAHVEQLQRTVRDSKLNAEPEPSIQGNGSVGASSMPVRAAVVSPTHRSLETLPKTSNDGQVQRSKGTEREQDKVLSGSIPPGIDASNHPAGSQYTPTVQNQAVNVHQSGWTNQLAQAMGHHAVSGQGELRVTVHPEGLGDLVITAHKSQEGVSLHVAASNASVANLLTQQTAQIQSTIRSQGVDVSNVLVSFGQASLLGGETSKDRRQNNQSPRSLNPFSGSVESVQGRRITQGDPSATMVAVRQIISVQV